jgi:molecular chaperone GrpE
LPALDNFDFAKKSLKADTDLEELNKCFDMLKAQFMMALESIGLQEINTDIAFDPELHEAVTSVPMPDKPEGTIIDVAKKGYKLNNKVIRAATVVVSAK